MNNQYVDLLIVGAGPAGLAAAISAREEGIESILILEREQEPGGILRQCIHNGFGLHRFHEELTGPEYAQRDIDRIRELNIPVECGTTVLSVSDQRVITCVSASKGFRRIQAGAVILALACHPPRPVGHRHRAHLELERCHRRGRLRGPGAHAPVRHFHDVGCRGRQQRKAVQLHWN